MSRKHALNLPLVACLFVFAGCSSDPEEESIQDWSVIPLPNQNTTTTTLTSEPVVTSEPTLDEPTWIYGSGIVGATDFLRAPYTQAACDIIRTELGENLDNPAKVDELLDDLDAMNDVWGLDAQIEAKAREAHTYLDIWIGVDALIKYFRETPENDYHFPASAPLTLSLCDDFNFTPENSKFGERF